MTQSTTFPADQLAPARRYTPIQNDAIQRPENAIVIITAIAISAGYAPAEVEAGVEFWNRKERRAHPPGTFDRGGRFYAEERTDAVLSCRSPSRAHPWPEMQAARTAAHCAELKGVHKGGLLAVRRVAASIDKLTGSENPTETVRQITKTLTKNIG